MNRPNSLEADLQHFTGVWEPWRGESFLSHVLSLARYNGISLLTRRRRGMISHSHSLDMPHWHPLTQRHILPGRSRSAGVPPLYSRSPGPLSRQSSRDWQAPGQGASFPQGWKGSHDSLCGCPTTRRWLGSGHATSLGGNGARPGVPQGAVIHSRRNPPLLGSQVSVALFQKALSFA